MAHDSLGAKNAPQYSATGVPADAADLTEVAAYAAQVGNRQADLASVRNGLSGGGLWTGLEFHETDTGNTYVYRGSTVGWKQIATGQTWSFDRSSGNESDSFPSGGTAFTNVLSASITNAPAGAYLVGTNWVTAGSVNSNLNVQYLVGGSNVTNNLRSDVTTQARGGSFTKPFLWTGGTLSLALGLLIGNGTGFVYTAGTGVWVTYLGPAA